MYDTDLSIRWRSIDCTLDSVLHLGSKQCGAARYGVVYKVLRIKMLRVLVVVPRVYLKRECHFNKGIF